MNLSVEIHVKVGFSDQISSTVDYDLIWAFILGSKYNFVGSRHGDIVISLIDHFV